MPEQAGSIGQVGVPLPPATAVNEGGLYTKVGTNTAETNLVFRAESNGFEYQLTKSIAASTASFSTYTAYNGTTPRVSGGWTFLPGGMLFQYGFLTLPVNGDIIKFPVAFSSFGITTLGVIRDNTDDKVVSINTGAITLSQFAIIMSNTSHTTGLYWQAVGK